MFGQRNHTINNFKKVSSNFHRMKAKLEDNVLIKPTSRSFKNIGHQFETDEEIETQKQCQTIKSKVNFQKMNNSFTNLNIQVQIKERTSEKKSRLKFFHCDSIAIRPSCHQFIQKQIQLDKTHKYLGNESDISTEQKKNQTFDKISIVDKNHDQPLIKSLRPSRLRNKMPIFNKKNQQKRQDPSFPNKIPKALLPYDIQKHREKIQKMTKQELFQDHIIFQTDQITQCCL